jgi:ABC-type nitrate/sulfonate/bicarbonate transport system substrate-binding protein
VAATRKGYEFAVSNPDEATDLLIAANSDALTDRKLIRASLQALIDGHYFRTESGVVGNIDPAKMDAIGNYLFDAKLLKNATGNIVTDKPDFAAYFDATLLPSK